MAGFRRTRKGLEFTVARLESGLLADLVGQLSDMLEPPPVADPLEALVGLRAQAPPPPEDPGLARLLPDAYRGDPNAAADFRRRTEDDLRASKRAAAALALASLPRAGGKVVLDEEAQQAWLHVLTDVRLVLATRLALRTDEDAEALYTLPDEDPRAPTAQLYVFLTYLQESLVELLQ
jgi:hypothetical protein